MYATALRGSADGDMKQQVRHSGESGSFGFNLQEEEIVVRQLAASEFFGWMSPSQIRHLAENLDTNMLRKRDILYRKGDSVTFVALIIDGSVSVSSPSLFGDDAEDTNGALHAADSCGCSFGPGDFASGIIDLLAAIVGVPMGAVGTAIVDTDATNVAKISAGALAALFAAFPGTREDMLQRTLMRMHRVTFIGIGSLFRSAMPWDRASDKSMPTRCLTPDRSTGKSHKQWDSVAADLLSEELGLDIDTLSPLIDFNKADGLGEADGDRSPRKSAKGTSWRC